MQLGRKRAGMKKDLAIRRVGVQTIGKNMFEALEGSEDGDMDADVTMIAHVDAEGRRLTREAAMRFNEADVKRPLASAVCVARAGNRIVVDETGGHIENRETKEKMEVRVEKNTYVYDIQMADGEFTTMTLDSGAGCNVWPRGKPAGGSRLEPKTDKMRMVAANGSEIANYGQRVIRSRGIDAGFTGRA